MRASRKAGWIPFPLTPESKMPIIGSMKTTIDIPEQALKDVMRFTKASTKRDAVVAAVEDFNRRQKLAALAKKLGTFDSLHSVKELMRLRKMK
jgi:Arc/MetJ family transcription regulator